MMIQKSRIPAVLAFDIRMMTILTNMTCRKHSSFPNYMKLIRHLQVHQAHPLVQNDIILLDGNVAVTTKQESGNKEEIRCFIICTDDTMKRVSSATLVKAALTIV